MLAYISWSLLYAAVPLIAGLLLQLWVMVSPGRRAVGALAAGVLLVSASALHDRDLTLLLAQWLAMPLLWLRVRSGS